MIPMNTLIKNNFTDSVIWSLCYCMEGHQFKSQHHQAVTVGFFYKPIIKYKIK